MITGKKNPNGAGKDPVKVRAQKRRYYLKHREEIIQKSTAYIKAHPEERKKVSKKDNAKRGILKRAWAQKKNLGLVVELDECALCGLKDKLVVHHRDGNNGKLGKPLNNKFSNLVVLCRKCHPKVHYRGEVRMLV